MSLSYYENNAEKYVQESLTFDMTVFNSFCQSILDSSKINSVLDLGFGSGRDILFFKEKGLSVMGIDGCQEFVSLGKEKDLDVYHEIIPFFEKEYPSFDFIYSVGMIFHLKENEREPLFQWIREHLNPGGILVLSYNELNRENDAERFFVTLKKEEIDSEVKLPIIKEEIMTDKRNIDWITTAYQL